MTKCDLLKLSFIVNFHNQNGVEFILIFLGTVKYDYCDKNKRNIKFSNSVNIESLSLSAIILPTTINILRFLFGLYSSIFL